MSIDKAVRAARVYRLNVSLSGTDDQILSSIKAARNDKKEAEREVLVAVHSQLVSTIILGKEYPLKSLVTKVTASLTDFDDFLSADSIKKHIEYNVFRELGGKTSSWANRKATIKFDTLDLPEPEPQKRSR